MWALSTCGEPDEIKTNTHPKYIGALFRDVDIRYFANFDAHVSWFSPASGVDVDAIDKVRTPPTARRTLARS